VGVFPKARSSSPDTIRLPHARGGVSVYASIFYNDTPSSPRSWGCFLLRRRCGAGAKRLPHARGGVSLRLCQRKPCRRSSPRSWGCFPKVEPCRVFPTLVGVFPPRRSRRRLKPCLPHARGGVSQAWIWPAIAFRSSPRSWGCFLSDSRRSCSVSVFPTLVGVFLGSMSSSARPMRLPHARGGVSGDQATEPPSQKSSPRSWGCFREIYGTRNDGRVFPTLVGVFPAVRSVSEYVASLPHARGGVSQKERKHWRC